MAKRVGARETKFTKLNEYWMEPQMPDTPKESTAVKELKVADKVGAVIM